MALIKSSWQWTVKIIFLSPTYYELDQIQSPVDGTRNFDGFLKKMGNVYMKFIDLVEFH
jgi:hypothetical protein